MTDEVEVDLIEGIATKFTELGLYYYNLSVALEYENHTAEARAMRLRSHRYVREAEKLLKSLTK